MSNQTYIHSDDSQLLADTIGRQTPSDAFLEIGVGNGGNLKIANNLFRLVVGTDIVNLRKVKKEFPSAEIVLSDRASCFRSNVFDLVAFNPPYIPSTEIVDKSVDGGFGGFEVPLSFLESATRVVKENGKIVMLASDQGNMSMLTGYCSQRSLSLRKVAEKSLFFETLYVFEITLEKR